MPRKTSSTMNTQAPELSARITSINGIAYTEILAQDAIEAARLEKDRARRAKAKAKKAAAAAFVESIDFQPMYPAQNAQVQQDLDAADARNIAAALQQLDQDPARATAIAEADADQTPLDQDAIDAALDASDIAYNGPQIDAAIQSADARLDNVVLLLDITTARPHADIAQDMAAALQDEPAAETAEIVVETSTAAQAPQDQGHTESATPTRHITRREQKAANRLAHAAARLQEAQLHYNAALHEAADAERDAVNAWIASHPSSSAHTA